MTAFDDLAEDLFDDDDLTDDAVFTPAVGDQVSCKVNLTLGTRFQPEGGLQAQAWGTETTIEYRLAEVGKEADADETFVIDETTYTVTDVLENDGLFVTVAVK